MKKVLISILLFFGATSICSASDFVYTNATSNTMYLKSDWDSSNGSQIASVFPVWGFSYSPDGAYIVYPNNSASQYMYRKNASDTANGSAITSQAVKRPVYSPDGLWIYYIKVSTADIYKKDASDTSNGTSMGVAAYTFDISPDGLWMYYSGSDWVIYKKSTGDTAAGSAINSIGCRFIAVSPDGLWLYYTHYDGGTGAQIVYKKSTADSTNGSAITTGAHDAAYLAVSPDGAYLLYSYYSPIYKKSTTDSLDGTAITSDNAREIDYPRTYVPPETCSDWIQNQDETGIDYGGVCGGVDFPYTWTWASAGTVCTSNVYLNSSDWDTTWNTDFWTLTPSAWTETGSANIGIPLGWNDISTDWLGKDAFRGIQFWAGSSLPHPIMTWSNTGSAAVVNYIPNEVLTPISAHRPIIFVATKRGWSITPFNVIQFRALTGSTTVPVTSVYFGHYDSSGTPVYEPNYEPATQDTSTWSTYTVRYRWTGYADFAQITPADGLQAMRLGTSSATTTKTECRNAEYACKWIKYNTGFGCQWDFAPAFDNPAYNATGECEVSAEWYCAPVQELRSLAAGSPEAWVYDSNGNKVGRTTDTNLASKDITNADIFSCSYTWLETLACPFQIAGKLWKQFLAMIKALWDLLKGISSLWSTAGTGKLMGLLENSFGVPVAHAEDLGKNLWAYWLTDWSGNILPDQAPSYTGADMAGINHSMFTAGDHAKNLDRGGIKGIWTFSYWWLMLVFAILIITLIGMSFGNNKEN